MAFKLDKKETARQEELVADLRKASSELEDAVSVYNDALEKLKAPVEEALKKYNDVVEEARGFSADIASRADDEITDKSERWQESERGEAASSWKDEWENASLDEIEIEFPDEIAVAGNDHADTLEGLPTEADG
jgi:hypothetical protein